MKHESGKRARKLRGKPADSEVQSQVSKDGCIHQKDGAPQGKREGAQKRPHPAERLYTATRKEKTEFRIWRGLIQQKDELAKFKSVGRSRVQCKREASRARREIAADRSVNDVAKQMTRTREKVIRTREGKERVKVRKFLPQPDDRKRNTRIEDTPAVPNKPTDHAVTRGRDVSLRYEGGCSPEHHTVALENTDEQQKQGLSQNRTQKQKQNTLL